MARPRKARVEGADAPAPKAPTPRPSKAFRAYVDEFRAKHPEKWDEIALTPLQHGVEAMAEVLERD